MVFHIITIFPRIFDSYFNEGTLKRAQKKGLIEIKIHNLRDFTDDKRKTVDDRPFGGGPGMVLKVEPIYKAIKHVKSIKHIKPIKSKVEGRRSKIILLSAKGKKLNRKLAYKFSKLNEIVFICGRYEGVDERVAKHIADEEISIGDYILSGGELATMVVIEAVTRLIPGVLGNIKSIEERRHNNLQSTIYNLQPKGGCPVYTRPEVFSPPHLLKSSRGKSGSGLKWKIPKVLLSGNHKKIDEWRRKHLSI